MLCMLVVTFLGAQSSLPGNLKPSGANNIKTAPANTNIQQPIDSMVIQEFPLDVEEKDKEQEKVIIPDSLFKVAESIEIDSNKIKRAGETDKVKHVGPKTPLPTVVNPEPTVIKTQKEMAPEPVTVPSPTNPIIEKEEVSTRNMRFANNRINAGSVRIGTSTDLNFLKLNKDTTVVDSKETANLNINAELGYFIWNNIEINVRGAYNNQMEFDSFSQELIKYEYGAGLRAYILGKLFGGVGYNWVVDEQLVFENPLFPFPTGTEKIESQYLKLEVGFAGFFNKFIAFEPTVFWTDVRETSNPSFIQDSFGFNIGLGIYFQNR